MKIYKNFRILDQTNDLVLGNIYEKVFLIKKLKNIEIYIDQFYGDPSCGTINTEFNKCLIGGENLVVFDINTNIKNTIELIRDIFDLRKKTEVEYEILTDPWSSSSAIWEYNIITNQIKKVSNFTKYKNREYSTEIDW